MIGDISSLMNYLGFSTGFFMALVQISVIILRVKMKHAPRTYKVLILSSYIYIYIYNTKTTIWPPQQFHILANNLPYHIPVLCLSHQYSSYSTGSSVGVWYDECDTTSVIRWVWYDANFMGGKMLKIYLVKFCFWTKKKWKKKCDFFFEIISLKLFFGNNFFGNYFWEIIFWKLFFGNYFFEIIFLK